MENNFGNILGAPAHLVGRLFDVLLDKKGG